MMEKRLLSVDIIRRGYGRRYTWLPVDELTRDGFATNCSGAYMRPECYDIRINDIARWRDGENFFQGQITSIQLDGDWLRARVEYVERISFEIYYG